MQGGLPATPLNEWIKSHFLKILSTICSILWWSHEDFDVSVGSNNVCLTSFSHNVSCLWYWCSKNLTKCKMRKISKRPIQTYGNFNTLCREWHFLQLCWYFTLQQMVSSWKHLAGIHLPHWGSTRGHFPCIWLCSVKLRGRMCGIMTTNLLGSKKGMLHCCHRMPLCWNQQILTLAQTGW